MYNFPWRGLSERRVNSRRVEYPLAGVFLGIGKVRRGNGHDTATPGVVLPETTYWFSTAKPRPTILLRPFPSTRDTYERRAPIFLALWNSVHVWIRSNFSSSRTSSRVWRVWIYTNVNISMLCPLESVVEKSFDETDEERGPMKILWFWIVVPYFAMSFAKGWIGAKRCWKVWNFWWDRVSSANRRRLYYYCQRYHIYS